MADSAKFSRSYYIFLIVFLGALSAFGPFITDMYLPTLPSMADIFKTAPTKVQLGLSTSMFGLAFGQVFFGPLSDKFGRKPILVASLTLFAVSTVASIYSPTIDFFNMCRFLQGLGGAGGIVMSRSIATDCYSGKELAKTMAIIGAINGVAPVTAPVIGGLVAESIGWQGIFWVLCGIGVVLIGMSFPFQESLEHDSRHTGKIFHLLKSFPELFKLKSFRLWSIAFAFAYGVLFAYISSSSFIVQDYYGYSELWFALIFAINSVGTTGGAALALKFKKLENAALFGECGIFVAAILQLIFYFTFDNFFIFEGLTFLILVFLGFIFTSVSAIAMDEGRSYIGAAAAVLGAGGFLFGGIISPIVGLGNIMTTTVIIFICCSLVSVLFSILGLKEIDKKTIFEKNSGKS